MNLYKIHYILLFIATGALWLLFSIVTDVNVVVCPSKLIFGIPCPGCGTTHAAKLLLSGDIVGSIIYNPNALLLISFAMVYISTVLWDYVCKHSIGATFCYFMPSSWRRLLYLFIFLIEVIIWIRNIIT